VVTTVVVVGAPTVATCLADRHNHRLVGVIDLGEVLDEFSAAFATQASRRLLDVFDDEQVCFIASEDLIAADRPSFERFIDAYTAQTVSFSFEWDSREVRRDGDIGWVVALGREIRHADEDTSAPFRMTLICRLRPRGWGIVHLHASTPVNPT
jgi:ketosteroid isomerase-like protein